MNQLSRSNCQASASRSVLERWHDNRSAQACNCSSMPTPQRAMEKLAELSAARSESLTASSDSMV